MPKDGIFRLRHGLSKESASFVMAMVTTHPCKNTNDRPECLVGVLLLSCLLPLEFSGLEIRC